MFQVKFDTLKIKKFFLFLKNYKKKVKIGTIRNLKLKNIVIKTKV